MSVTRVVVVDSDGHPHEFWGDSWQMFPQDDMATMKLIASGDGSEARELRDLRLGLDISEINRKIREGHDYRSEP